MSSDQDQYISDQERKIRQSTPRQGPSKQTMEVVELERQGAPLPQWQQWLINGLAVVGAIAIIYLIVTQVF